MESLSSESIYFSHSAGIDLANEWNNGFIIKSGALITVQGPNERDIEKLTLMNRISLTIRVNIWIYMKDQKVQKKYLY